MTNILVVKKYHQLGQYFAFQQPLVWRNVIGLLVIHILAIYATFYVIPKTHYFTTIWNIIIGNLAGLGVTAGAHRLWTHKTYKAKLPLRIFLMCLYVTAGQYSLESWVRDHRAHHKYADTDADPHNAKRGFFFSHCGWLMMKRHSEVKNKGKLIDVSDLHQDPVVRFQEKYFVLLSICFCGIFPMALPLIFWGECLSYTILEVFFFRYSLQLHFTWIVNSFAHLYGTKPYNKNIMAVQNTFVSIFALGEGWHNYHHVFPWDYRIGEYGQGLQTAARFIKWCEFVGLAYDLKVASPEIINKVIQKQNVKELPEPSVFVNNKQNFVNNDDFDWPD